jgi:hypothetical protein
MLRPLSVLGSRFTQLMSWILEPPDLADSLVPKEKQKDILISAQKKISSYQPPPYLPIRREVGKN